MCGIAGVLGWADPKTIAKPIGGLLAALQHRGRAAAGAAAIEAEGASGITRRAAPGLVKAVFHPSRMYAGKEPVGTVAVGHVRYPTTGENTPFNHQPYVQELPHIGWVALVHNGNISNAAKLRAELASQGHTFQSTSDTELILKLMGLTMKSNLPEAFKAITPKLEGSYSLIIITHNEMLLVRDPHGNRPLWYGYGRGEGSTIYAASEDLPLRHECVDIDQVPAGTMMYIQGTKYISKLPLGMVATPRPCIFEPVYYANAASTSPSGASNALTRVWAGHALAELIKAKGIEVDYIIPVMESGAHAAHGVAEALRIPINFGMPRNPDAGRSFIADHKERGLILVGKYYFIRDLIEGKRVLWVDDSLVRSTTSKSITQRLRDARAVEVHGAVASPPIIAPCQFGIDMPDTEKLIAVHKSEEEIRQAVGLNSLTYLPRAQLEKACGGGTFCSTCMGGAGLTQAA